MNTSIDKKKLLLDVSAIGKGRTIRGMGYYLLNKMDAIIGNARFKIYVVSNNDIPDVIKTKYKDKLQVYIFKCPLPLFEQIVMPILISIIKPEYCWFPANTFPIIKHGDTKYIVTIHDVIFNKREIRSANIYQKIGKFYRAFIINNCFKNIDYLTSVSKTALNEIIKYYNLKSGGLKTKVLFNALTKSMECDNQVFKKCRVYKLKYFLTISGSSGHKNLMFLINVYSDYLKYNEPFPLVICGISDQKQRLPFIELSKKLGIEKCIVFTDYLSEEMKNALLKYCKVFIMSSLFEGFGIPLIEALNFNKKSLASDIPVFHECAGKYAIYFNPYDENDLLNKWTKITKSENITSSKKYIQKKFGKYKIDSDVKNFLNALP